MWRYDANRSAASAQELPDKLNLHWVRHYPRLQPAWKDPLNRYRMPFDRAYEPVVSGHTVFLGSSGTDKVVALDTRTGSELWAFYADGPVRLPPVVWRGKLYFASDDGCLYCLHAETGQLVWKFRGGPSDRKILGNERLISTWPARGGPVLADGTVYFASGIWPFMGVFIHALDAQTGRVIWTNDGSGATFMPQPHNSPAFAGVAPQGAMVVVGDRLLVPGGRSVPACFDRRTGRMLYYRLAENPKRGGSHVSAISGRFFNHVGPGSCLFDLKTGALLINNVGGLPVLTDEAYYFGGGSGIVALAADSLKEVEYEIDVKDAKTGETSKLTKTKWVIDPLWECPMNAAGALIKAGSRLYAGGAGQISAIEVPPRGGAPAVVWTKTIDGTVSGIVAGDDRLIVVTLEGSIYCYGGAVREDPLVYPYVRTPALAADATTRRVAALLNETGVREGYCLAYGVTTSRLLEELLRQSDLRVIAFNPDPVQVERLRRRLDGAGLYGRRVAVHVGGPMSVDTPPYLASLTLIENARGARYDNGGALVARIFRSMRPYGGVACFPVDENEASSLAALIEQLALPGARVERAGEGLLLWRDGALPGAGTWTHQYGDIANTVKSDDTLVRAPLGLLWFGGSSHADVLPRHGHGPPEQVIGGRLFIQGIDCLSARDVYTGRVLWKRELPGLNTFGVYYDDSHNPDPLDPSYNQLHMPGANARGTNFVATEDRLYVARGERCLVLAPATGVTVAEFRLPVPEGETEPPEWGYLGIYEDLLIAGADFVRYSDSYRPEKPSYWTDYDRTSSKRLVAMNRYTGRVVWSFDSQWGLRHNAIAVGNGKLFCIDMMPQSISDVLARRGREAPGRSRLAALDVRTGEEIWSTTEDVFGTWLGYSEQHDVLLEAGRRSRDMLLGEPDERTTGYRGADGEILWSSGDRYRGPVMLHGDTIITQSRAFNLLTGKGLLRRHPLTDEEVPWSFQKHYGCGTAICSEYLITFRSAAAGFFDLTRDAGTGNLGGFRAGCTSNLVAADGVLNAPDYTRTCTCSYQNQTSLAMVHMAGNEMWTFSDLPSPTERRVRRVGINLGAPGDRLSESGVLWLDHPSVGGASPDIPVRVEPETVKWFHRHSSNVTGDGLRWVAASGCRGVTRVVINLPSGDEQDPPGIYTVRLHFADPDNDAPGRRVFDVRMQGEDVLRSLDIVGETGGRWRTLVKEFKDVVVADELVLEFVPRSPGTVDPSRAGVISGVEIVMGAEAGRLEIPAIRRIGGNL